VPAPSAVVLTCPVNTTTGSLSKPGFDKCCIYCLASYSISQWWLQ
jgi:hypothetical protein